VSYSFTLAYYLVCICRDELYLSLAQVLVFQPRCKGIIYDNHIGHASCHLAAGILISKKRIAAAMSNRDEGRKLFETQIYHPQILSETPS